MSKRCAFLSMDDMADFVSDADLAIAPMAEFGWSVEYVSWRATPVDWNRYDAVYLCTPWDYPEDHDGFLGVLKAIDASRALLVNSLGLVRWNLDKTYLRDIEARGGAIVPSRWVSSPTVADIRAAFATFGVSRIVVKPVIGANAVDTFVIAREAPDAELEAIARVFAQRRSMLQPFIDSVTSEGEYSLFFFSGEYSHAIRKVPERGDFRVQEEHGAAILAVDATDELIAVARDIVALVEPEPVYARADFVRDAESGFLLM
ncbi:MAG: hypothetical protein AAFX10_11740, partial [Pseudomonadota bacterium]